MQCFFILLLFGGLSHSFPFRNTDFAQIPFADLEPLEILVKNQTEGTAQLVQVNTTKIREV